MLFCFFFSYTMSKVSFVVLKTVLGLKCRDITFSIMKGDRDVKCKLLEYSMIMIFLKKFPLHYLKNLIQSGNVLGFLFEFAICIICCFFVVVPALHHPLQNPNLLEINQIESLFDLMGMEICYILTFDPAQKYYSKVIHRKEVTHSNGQ